MPHPTTQDFDLKWLESTLFSRQMDFRKRKRRFFSLYFYVIPPNHVVTLSYPHGSRFEQTLNVHYMRKCFHTSLSFPDCKFLRRFFKELLYIFLCKNSPTPPPIAAPPYHRKSWFSDLCGWTDRRTTDNMWSVNLTWAFSSSVPKTQFLQFLSIISYRNKWSVTYTCILIYRGLKLPFRNRMLWMWNIIRPRNIVL